MSGNITCTGSLPVGILFDGKLHQDVVLGLATVGDEIAVIEDGVSDAGVPIAVLARTLTKIGDIPAQSITYELLCDNLVSEDYAFLRTLRDEVKKKAQIHEQRFTEYRYTVIRLGRYGISEEKIRLASAVELAGWLDAITRRENPKAWQKNRTVISLRRPRNRARSAASR
ncbi:hypothetical protein [Candidatus Erwinia dacicola]|uniref:Uncharacterized protein n=1 Tax=Candidatus Erwinia dacicola TaxID=252393 RepID=A0A328TNN2_9GAMM|nr:hypothetical protein [Candidatus Erwinia dacicola]RAP72217.1 hypothetical protein ACZ87_00951 [Candidatus Erwinia dacicola]